MKKISIKGVLIGGVVDIVSTNIAVLPLTLYIMRAENLMSLPPQEGTKKVLEIMHTNSLYYAITLILGGICSILGGYVAARIAKREEILNGALASFLCVGSGIYAIASGESSAPLWLHVLFLLLSPSVAAFGGFLRLRQLDKTGQAMGRT